DLLENDEREEMQSLRLNLKASIGRLDLLGSKFELEAKSLDGRIVRIDDYAGKFVIVDFFASWCGPCLTEVPHLKKQFEKYQDKGLEVIAISLDTEADALDKYLQRAELPWPVIHDDHEDPLQRLQMKFGVSNLPTVLLLNKEGVVVSLEARDAELDRLMQMLFETPTLADPASAPPGEPPVATPPEKSDSRVEPSKS
ncbi:MAG: TlpA disulfide reductase family protein, partial [Aureliella sp.]